MQSRNVVATPTSDGITSMVMRVDMIEATVIGHAKGTFLLLSEV